MTLLANMAGSEMLGLSEMLVLAKLGETLFVMASGPDWREAPLMVNGWMEG